MDDENEQQDEGMEIIARQMVRARKRLAELTAAEEAERMAINVASRPSGAALIAMDAAIDAVIDRYKDLIRAQEAILEECWTILEEWDSGADLVVAKLRIASSAKK